MKNRNEILKKRSQAYRSVGIDSVSARILSQRKLDVSDLKLDRRGKIIKDRKYSAFVMKLQN